MCCLLSSHLLHSCCHLSSALVVSKCPTNASVSPHGEVWPFTDVDETSAAAAGRAWQGCTECSQMEGIFNLYFKDLQSLTQTLQSVTGFVPGSQRPTGHLESWEGFSPGTAASAAMWMRKDKNSKKPEAV